MQIRIEAWRVAMSTVALLLSLLCAVQDDLEKRISALIGDLRSEEIATREKATKALSALGIDAIPALEKFQAGSEGEVRARLEAALTSLRREVKLLKLAPPVKTVSTSSKDRPLKDVVSDLASQAGLAITIDPAITDRPVTLETRGEPFFQVLDRLCHSRGDVTYEVAEGKIKVAPGAFRNSPVAYAGAFRARLKRVATHEVNDFGARRTDMVLYIQLDAQPDQKFVALAAVSAELSDGLLLKSASASLMAWMMSRGDQHLILVEETPVLIEAGETPEGVYILKNVPPGLKSITSLKLRAIARYPMGSIPKSMSLKSGKLNTDDGVLPFVIQKSGHHIFIQSVQRRHFDMPRPLEELVEVDSFVAVDKDGTEIKLENQTRRPPGVQYTHRYQFVAGDGDLKATDLTLKFNMVDLVDREVEFELKDIRLRD